jgi:molecular chaperone GrpE
MKIKNLKLKIKDKKEENNKELENQVNDLTNKWKRALADYQNLEKQVAMEKKEWIIFANRSLILELLPVLDNLQKSAEHLKDQGLQLTVDQFQKILADQGLEEIIIKTGQTIFDCHQMECVETRKGKKDIVLEVVQKGYKLHNKIIRPAKVIVGKE